MLIVINKADNFNIGLGIEPRFPKHHHTGLPCSDNNGFSFLAGQDRTVSLPE